MSIMNSTEADGMTAEDPVQRMESIGTALILASETLHDYAHQIINNVQRAVASLSSD